MALKYKSQILDEADSAFFARELEQVLAKQFEVKYANLKARSLIPVSFEVDPGARTITYDTYDMVGLAKIVMGYSDDIPRADVRGTPASAPVRTLASSFGYNVDEIAAARFAGKPLQQMKANAAKKAIMTRENQIAFTGDSKSGLPGLVNNANVPLLALPADGTGATTTWSTKTPAQILRDMHLMANTIVNSTMEVEVPNTLLLPLAAFNLIASTPWSTGNDGRTILEIFKQQSQYIKEVVPVAELATAGVGGVSRAIAYRKDPDALQLMIALDFTQLPPQARNLEEVVICRERLAGTLVYYPLSMIYADGI